MSWLGVAPRLGAREQTAWRCIPGQPEAQGPQKRSSSAKRETPGHLQVEPRLQPGERGGTEDRATVRFRGLCIQEATLQWGLGNGKKSENS